MSAKKDAVLNSTKERKLLAMKLIRHCASLPDSPESNDAVDAGIGQRQIQKIALHQIDRHIAARQGFKPGDVGGGGGVLGHGGL